MIRTGALAVWCRTSRRDGRLSRREGWARRGKSLLVLASETHRDAPDTDTHEEGCVRAATFFMVAGGGGGGFISRTV